MNNPLTSPTTRKAANVLGIVLLIALVAPFAAFAAPEVVGADESFVVLTASMTPAIAPGDVVIVAERDPTAIAAGDVITFSRGTSDVPVTHRVVDVVAADGGVAFETRGDANEDTDPGLVPATNLIGEVVFVIPYIGYVIQFAGTRAGFVALVVLPFGLLAASELWSIARDSGQEPTPDPDPSAAAAADAAETGARDASIGAARSSPEESAVEVASGGVSVAAVGGAVAVLAGFAPYAAYVAFELRDALSIAVAVAATAVLLGALVVWIPASGVFDRSAPDDDARVDAARASSTIPEEAAAPADGAGEGD
ncbi:signal peptidase I [Halorubrum sp. AD140]|uniref:signal peptidase I n=1 Tax=Halorubrum sp. AD140 TaxID=3050073 RepID=UPI002ACD1267|nr:signal peptidase I [Halorubrum sp. AD140]MDZ5811347.1 signal peptidase I [Halorubrum sp. AD140]